MLKGVYQLSKVESQHQLLADVITPLWRLSYADQLAHKHRKLSRQLWNLSKKLQAQYIRPILDADGYVCRLSPIVPSPKVVEYRNKSEYQVGVGLDGNSKTVGFYVNYQVGKGELRDVTSMVSIPPTNLTVERHLHKRIAQVYQTYIRSSQFPPYLPTVRKGNYRDCRVRSNVNGDYMISLIFAPYDLQPNEIEAEADKMTRHFIEATKHQPPTAIFFQLCKMRRCFDVDSPFQLRFGLPQLQEKLLNFTFNISPDSFFQTNTAGAEMLLKTIMAECHLDPNKTVLLDICCGTGIYSVALSKHVKRSIGIDISSKAIGDSRANAKLNGVDNVEYICGRAEKHLSDILRLKVSPGEEVVAIANPHRWGLEGNTVRAIRDCSALKRLIFVSCHPFDQAAYNFYCLCRPASDTHTGKSFSLTKAIPVDLFPQIDHCELVLVFER